MHSDGDAKDRPSRWKRRRKPPTPAQVRRREKLAAQVRSVLIARLDSLAAAEVMQPAIEELGLDFDQWIKTLQRMQLALFPEEFGEPTPKEKVTKGLIPRGGRIGRVSWDTFKEFAKLLKAG